jgi:protocatechuate 3,4-dioxygenase beta subunit
LTEVGRPHDERPPSGDLAARFSRRRLLAWSGGVALAALLPACARDDEAGDTTPAARGATDATTTGAGASPDCVLTPELTEGPYYLDLDRVRRDITEGKDGLPFDLRVLVVDADTCEPIPDAAVDVWHCDADGEYSGVEGNAGTSLRGIQIADAEGAARFRTIFPGWYPGRAVHIHVKVHVGRNETFTGQLFFGDETLDAVYANEPYRARGDADTSNETDGIFAESSGSTVVDVTVDDDSCSGSVTLGVQPA